MNRRRVGSFLPVLLLAACDEDSLPIYDEAELAYFEEIAFGTENGNPWDTITVAKWQRDVRVRIAGFPSARQETTVHAVAAELDELTDGVRVLSLERGSNAPATVEILFITHDSMTALIGDFAEGLRGYFRYYHRGDYAIDSAQAVIAYDRGSPDLLDHTIREELTQLLGLGQDSWTYPESVFYEGPAAVTEFAPIDRSVIRMLYDRRIEAGMNRDQALRILGAEYGRDAISRPPRHRTARSRTSHNRATNRRARNGKPRNHATCLRERRRARTGITKWGRFPCQVLDDFVTRLQRPRRRPTRPPSRPR